MSVKDAAARLGVGRLQASHDKAHLRDEEKRVAVRGYMPSFLTITAEEARRLSVGSQQPR